MKIYKKFFSPRSTRRARRKILKMDLNKTYIKLSNIKLLKEVIKIIISKLRVLRVLRGEIFICYCRLSRKGDMEILKSLGINYTTISISPDHAF